eukprot:1823675-Rhodomonas_salina.1
MALRLSGEVLRNQMQYDAVSIQFVPGMCDLHFDFAAFRRLSGAWSSSCGSLLLRALSFWTVPYRSLLYQFSVACAPDNAGGSSMEYGDTRLGIHFGMGMRVSDEVEQAGWGPMCLRPWYLRASHVTNVRLCAYARRNAIGLLRARTLRFHSALLSYTFAAIVLRYPTYSLTLSYAYNVIVLRTLSTLSNTDIGWVLFHPTVIPIQYCTALYTRLSPVPGDNYPLVSEKGGYAKPEEAQVGATRDVDIAPQPPAVAQPTVYQQPQQPQQPIPYQPNPYPPMQPDVHPPTTPYNYYPAQPPQQPVYYPETAPPAVPEPAISYEPQCPPSLLRACCAKSGTPSVVLRAAYAVSGTNLGHVTVQTQPETPLEFTFGGMSGLQDMEDGRLIGCDRRCPRVIPPRYAMSGTDIAYGARSRAGPRICARRHLVGSYLWCYALFGTEMRAMSGTEIEYGGRREQAITEAIYQTQQA